MRISGSDSRTIRRASRNDPVDRDAETASRLKRKASLREARRFLDTVEESDLFFVESVREDVFERASRRFRDWDDHGASFTEFVIATQMESRDIEQIATYDRGFESFDVTVVPYRA